MASADVEFEINSLDHIGRNPPKPFRDLMLLSTQDFIWCQRPMARRLSLYTGANNYVAVENAQDFGGFEFVNSV